MEAKRECNTNTHELNERGSDKRVFEFPEYESVRFEWEDVILTSCCNDAYGEEGFSQMP